MMGGISLPLATVASETQISTYKVVSGLYTMNILSISGTRYGEGAYRLINYE